MAPNIQPLIPFIAFFGVFTSLVLAKTDSQDVSALNDAYKSMNSPSKLNGWSSSGGDPCGDSWDGITCKGSSVTQIKVSGRGLSGSLGYQLANLKSLTYLDVSKNNLNGNLPYQLPENLVYLDGSENDFNGNVPYSVSQMNDLTYLQNLGVGYNAPECADPSAYTLKSDVYSFGVVMLELLTGRMPYDSDRPKAEQSLVRWAKPKLKDMETLEEMVDPGLCGLYAPESVSAFADIVSICVMSEPGLRPPVSNVVEALKRLV
ncbi:hypothetical protein F2Q68_00032823 [Brassica cretica]|uniref:Protein kinase domain-containing protein n=1 Tax=Brassica cretica TaxID=69181 RepID=A0A8S9GI37_BRACR|nr:hypothetical protein F2Q68_00032823 [Brassica cretica]